MTVKHNKIGISMRATVFFAATFAWGMCVSNCSEDFEPCDDACESAQATYDPTITTIMEDNCLPCHASNAAQGEVILDTYDGVKARVENTQLVNAINHNPGYPDMPQGRAKLAQCDIDKIQAWIKAGSYDPEPLDRVFIQPVQACQGLACSDDLVSEDDLVCTPLAISGATEEGRSFLTYSSCDVVYSQRPYFVRPPFNDVDANDPRLDDQAFVAELNWINSQVRSTGCVCCHDTEGSGLQAAVWDISAPGVWTDQLSDQGAAILSGKVSSDILGVFPAEENNGFDRDSTGFPTTDVARTQAFFQQELDRRGMTDEVIAELEPFGQFLLDVVEADPVPCTAQEGILADGKIHWERGEARYIYVKEFGSENPGVPPSNDNPEGVLWRLDVMANVEALASGTVDYGQVPTGTYQVTPANNAAAPTLTTGETYQLYVLQDILLPLCNCNFTAP